MAEEADGPEAGSEFGVDPAAMAVALGSASRGKADRFLEEQTALAVDQRRHLHEQFKQLRLSIWQQRMGVLLRVATAIVGCALAAGITFLVWDAAHSQGLVIEPFAVPADMAAKGLSGQVVASQLLDKLNAMQASTQSQRPPQSYSNNWGSDLHVEIPETGVSIGELQIFLRGWLGHDTHISGEVWRTANGIAVTVRTNTSAGETVTGAEADLDGLMQQAAESVYRTTQPYRYANFLDRNAFRPGAPLRIAEAEAIYRRLIYDPNPIERAWAWNGLGNLAWTVHGSEREALQDYARSNAISPIATGGQSSREANLGHLEAALALTRNALQLNTANAPTHNAIDAFLAELTGDYAGEFRLCRIEAEQPFNNTVYNHDYAQRDCLAALSGMHDGAGTRAWIRALPPLEVQANSGLLAMVLLRADTRLGNWAGALSAEPAAEKAYVTFDSGFDLKTIFTAQLRPWLALAKAKLGDQAGAEALIATTPGDCYDCVRIRGAIAAQAQQSGRADYWFAKAVHDAPSIPYAYADWGTSLLARDQPDAAIAQFKLSNAKGPHFADPLEFWGEALMAKKDSGAAAKFAEAEKYAPNWGRLHLKWGEALSYAGHKDDAQKQFALAATLDLSAADKAELATVNSHG